VPEFARRMTVSSCRHDPVPAFTPVLTAMPAAGIPLGDVLADSGYSHRVPRNWASPLRKAGAALVQDLHPHDRGPKGTHAGAVIANGSLYCPRTPRTLLELAPLSRAATPQQAAQHDAKTAEAARYKLGRLTADDEDGYHRVACPAAAGKVRCPLRPASMSRDRDRPEILQPPGHPQACCTQQTLTVPPGVLAKTAQKHDYPSAAWRRSYARRSGAERGFATAKDPASNTISRGWCRLTGLTPLMLFTTALLTVRNQRILTAWNARQEDHARRAAKGQPPQIPPAPAQDAHRDRIRGPALTAVPARTATTNANTTTAPARPHTGKLKPGTAKGRLRRPLQRPRPGGSTHPPGMSDPNVKLGPHET